MFAFEGTTHLLMRALVLVARLLTYPQPVGDPGSKLDD